ncbi:AAA family ATPase [Variovorax sp. J22R133]|uniref:ATP-binding protein n=1 Tax=Variovorax brevis TaxID=3053503 RepID=UPI0025767D17|nr:AAA family ATPase [Variovorax sp. J22R133]MDM0110589.1 AAA family ATPase [Variovorax sp. J22R133]
MLPSRSANHEVTPGDSEGQRRHLTLLFADLSDSTRLGEMMEAEDYADMLASLRRLCHEIIPRHGGQIARIQGDGVLAFFGYPVAREDDGRRAADAALELHVAVSQIQVHGEAAALAPLTLHSGIHGGLVYLSGGDLERGRFDLLGNVPNVAARLSTLAESDDIYISEETLGPHARFFHVGERVEVKVKGRTEPLAVHRLLGKADGQGPSWIARRALCPFVGRQQPLRQLRDHLRKAIAGTPECVTVRGDPGVGKTRLIDELLRHASAAQCLFLKGYCENYFSAEPLQPFAQMLRAIATMVEAEPQAWQAHKGLIDEGMPAFARLVDAMAADKPLLLVIDDWQWADDASQQLLDALLALHRPLLVVLATREHTTAELLTRQSATIELHPLDEAEAAEAVEFLCPGCDPFVAAEIRRYAGGVPLFLEELCQSTMARGGALPPGPKAGSGAWLNSLIGSRVERLPPAQAELVRAAAVIGNVFPEWLLAEVATDGGDHEMVDALAAQDLVYPGEVAGTLRFKHALTRDVIYESVGLHRRKELHRRIARAQEARGDHRIQDDGNETLAYHCAAGELRDEAARYAELAGDKAMAASALDRARDQYAAALQALDAMGPNTRELQLRWCGVAQKLGLACVFDPLGFADALTTFKRGVDLARASGDIDALARAEYWLGYVHYSKGQPRAAIAHCEDALDLALQHGMDRLAAQVRATLGQALLSACEYDRALYLLDDALQSKRVQSRPGGNIAVGSAYTLACKGYLLGDRGQFGEAKECFDEALRLLGGTVHQVASSVRHWLSVVQLWQGRWHDALRAADEATSIAAQVKSRQQFAMGRALAGYARWMQSRSPEGLRVVKDATAWIEARKGELATSLNHGWLVEGALAQGDEELARRHAARLFLRVRQDDRIGEALACRALATAAAKGNDFERAERYVQQAFRSAEVRGSAHEVAVTQLCQGQLELQRGHGAAGRELLDRACAAFESMDMRWHLDKAQRALAQAG